MGSLSKCPTARPEMKAQAGTVELHACNAIVDP